MMMMLPMSKYAVCPGIPDYIKLYSGLIRHPIKCLRKICIGDEIYPCAVSVSFGMCLQIKEVFQVNDSSMYVLIANMLTVY